MISERKAESGLRERLKALVVELHQQAATYRRGQELFDEQQARAYTQCARKLTAILAESEGEPSFRDVTATRCLRHATIPPTIMPPATQECGLCMREEGILVGRSEQRPETAWLIESRFKPAPSWWTGTGWSGDSLSAVRFCRKQDAEAEMAQLPDFHTCFASEHQWGFSQETGAIDYSWFKGEINWELVEKLKQLNAAKAKLEPSLPLGHEFYFVDDGGFAGCALCGQPREAHEPKP